MKNLYKAEEERLTKTNNMIFLKTDEGRTAERREECGKAG